MSVQPGPQATPFLKSKVKIQKFKNDLYSCSVQSKDCFVPRNDARRKMPVYSRRSLPLVEMTVA